MARPLACPPWQKALILMSGVSVALMLTFVLSWGRTILIPMAVAVFLAFVLSPVVRVLVRRRVPRGVAVILTTTIAALLSAGLLWTLTRQVASLTMTLPDHRERIVRKVAELKSWVSGGEKSRLGQLLDEIESTVSPNPAPGTVPLPVVAPAGGGWERWERLIGPVVEGLGQFAFACVLVVFLLLMKDDIRDRFIRLMGDGRLTQTTKALEDASDRVSRFLLKQFVFNLAFGIVVTLMTFLLGLPYAILWGAIAAVMRYVPYVGTWVGVIPPTIYAWALSDTWGLPLSVLGSILVLEVICNNFIEPFLYGASLGVSEMAQLVAAGVWSFLWGPIGLVLSGPLTTCLLVLGKYVPGLKFLDVLLGNEPSLDPGVMFFQRITARDEDGAATVFDESLAAKDPAAAVEDVILPALQLLKTADMAGELSPDAVARAVAAVREIADDLPAPAPADEPVVGPIPRLLVVPARDDIDAVAGECFLRLLPAGKWDATRATNAPLVGELVERVRSLAPDLVVIASVRPGGRAHARYLTKRLRADGATVKLIVGDWGDSANVNGDAGTDEGVERVLGFAETLRLVVALRPTVAEPTVSPARLSRKQANVDRPESAAV
jgi:predicted PurR-regulated permease PerM